VSRRFIMVVGAKGGGGATTVALALADRMSEHGNCVLVDGDLGGRRSHALLLDLAAELDVERLPGSPGVARAAKVSLIELTRSY
jgi:Mrp family chromosome partitioning ATPase